jgi:hypothetical protein
MITKIKTPAGTKTGRFDSKTPQQANTPKSNKARTQTPVRPKTSKAIGYGEPNMMFWVGDSDSLPPGIEICGMHLGPNTKQSHPYSYDPLLVFVNKNVAPNGSAYSDRIENWYERSVIDEKLKTHFGETSRDFGYRSAPAVQKYLRDLFGHPKLELTRIEEHCNMATGYPVWYFAYNTHETKAE